jgi:hypothetical protein
MFYKVIAENNLFAEFSWKLNAQGENDKGLHTFAVIQSMHDFIDGKFDQLFNLYMLDGHNVGTVAETEVYKRKYIDLLGYFHYVWTHDLSETEQDITRLAAIYHDFYYTRYSEKDMRHGELGAPLAAADMTRRGFAPELIQKVCQVVYYHGFTSDLGSHILLPDIKNIQPDILRAVIFIEIFDMMGRYNKYDGTGQRISYAFLGDLEHIAQIKQTLAELCLNSNDFYIYRLKNIVAPFVHRPQDDPDASRNILFTFNYLPDTVQEKIKCALNNYLRIYDFPLTKDLYYISQEILGEGNLELFFKQLYFLSLLGQEHPNIKAENLTDEDSQQLTFMSIPNDKKINYLKGWAKFLQNYSFTELADWQNNPELTKKLRFDGNTVFIDVIQP